MSNQNSLSDNLKGYQKAIAENILQRLNQTTDWTSPIPDLMFFRRDKPTPPDFCLIEPSLVLVVQGKKQIGIAGHEYPYDTTNFLITSLDLPATSQVVEASATQPCLGLAIKLDIRILSELISQGGLPHKREKPESSSIGLGTMTNALLDPINRLVNLLHEPSAINTLAPLIKREIHYRLLLSDQSGLLRQTASIDSQSYRVAKAINWLKLNFAMHLRVDELAAQVQMSAPTFHHHFRQLTAMSPLQYQKWLRLNEAKRLMLNEHLDASSAGFQVGYESPSQFSREYSRLFGVPPKRDIVNMRQVASVSGTP